MGELDYTASVGEASFYNLLWKGKQINTTQQNKIRVAENQQDGLSLGI